jgi:hypothetical protein
MPCGSALRLYTSLPGGNALRALTGVQPAQRCPLRQRSPHAHGGFGTCALALARTHKHALRRRSALVQCGALRQPCSAPALCGRSRVPTCAHWRALRHPEALCAVTCVCRRTLLPGHAHGRPHALTGAHVRTHPEGGGLGSHLSAPLHARSLKCPAAKPHARSLGVWCAHTWACPAATLCERSLASTRTHQRPGYRSTVGAVWSMPCGRPSMVRAVQCGTHSEVDAVWSHQRPTCDCADVSGVVWLPYCGPRGVACAV